MAEVLPRSWLFNKCFGFMKIESCRTGVVIFCNLVVLSGPIDRTHSAQGFARPDSRTSSSSINLARSITYGLGVLRTSLQYFFAKTGIYKAGIFR